jgi:hypothetical protein
MQSGKHMARIDRKELLMEEMLTGPIALLQVSFEADDFRIGRPCRTLLNRIIDNLVRTPPFSPLPPAAGISGEGTPISGRL